MAARRLGSLSGILRGERDGTAGRAVIIKVYKRAGSLSASLNIWSVDIVRGSLRVETGSRLAETASICRRCSISAFKMFKSAFSGNSLHRCMGAEAMITRMVERTLRER